MSGPVAKLLLPLLSASVFLLAAAAPSFASPLVAERWKTRVVLVFAPAGGGKLDKQVDALLLDKAALAERDMLVLAIAGSEVSASFGKAAGPLDAAALRQAYAVAADAPFTVILVGKDGGEKLRAERPVAARDLFGLVDAMPVRRREASG